ncbi:MAG: hypothetical protein COA73_18080 [Candidatus Hydrogenedentota bacterium]|nr:MAG: hypothetical protein COA73_18080 [Candidatus Hydrogenedentota bacterium]
MGFRLKAFYFNAKTQRRKETWVHFRGFGREIILSSGKQIRIYLPDGLFQVYVMAELTTG